MSSGDAFVVALLVATAVLLVLPPRRPEQPEQWPEQWDTPAEGRARPRAASRARRGQRSDLPHLVGLVAAGVEAGAPVPVAVLRACDAFAEATFDDLRSAAETVRRGADPRTVWAGLGDPEVAPLARTLARSARTGASVVRSLSLLADDLADEARSLREDAARRVGVRAALPLGLCLLPAFLVLGIVPLVAGLASQVVAP